MQNQFIITFYSSPPATDQALTRVAAEGFNLTWVPEEGLDVAARHHLRAMLTSDLLRPDVLEDIARRAQLDALIERVKRHPALEAYFLIDEPGADSFPSLGRLVAYLRERDPAHVAYINLFPTYASEQQLQVSTESAERSQVDYHRNLPGLGTNDAKVLRYREYLRRFVETVKPDLISYDHYHFFKESDGKEYFLNLGLIRSAATEANRPFINTIQANTIEKTWRLPNGREMRWLVFTTLAYGGRGISWFTYWGPKSYNGLYQDGSPSPRLADVIGLNAEIANFGPTLMQLNSLGAYHTAPLPEGATAIPTGAPVQISSKGEFVLGLFGAAGQATAFMIVNRDYSKASDARLKITGRNLQELDRKSGKWGKPQRPSSDGTMKIHLEPGDGRFFRIGE